MLYHELRCAKLAAAINLFSILQKWIKIPRPNLHPGGAANSFITEFKVDPVHGLVKPDAFLVIFKQVDLVTTCGQLTKSHPYQSY